MEVREKDAKLETLNGHFEPQSNTETGKPPKLKEYTCFRCDGHPDSGFKRRMPRSEQAKLAAR